MRSFFIGLLVALTLIFAGYAHAEERITSYGITMEATENGDLIITENITVNVEGDQIRRGIFRDFPRYLLRETGQKIPQRYEDIRVTLDGERVKYETSRNGNQMRLRIGDEDIMVSHAIHTYAISYRVPNALRRADGREEIYWNPIGAFWLFPIDRAEITLKLPDGINADGIVFYRGGQGSNSRTAPQVAREGPVTRYVFDTPFARLEGLTMSLIVEQGSFAPLTTAQKRAQWWEQYGGSAALGMALAALLAMFGLGWNRVGRDPDKGPIIPLYGPPENLSPAVASYIYYRRIKGHQPIIATLTNLAIKDYLKIDVDKKVTTIITLNNENGEGLPAEEQLLYDKAFKGKTVRLGRKPNPAFASAARKFSTYLTKHFGNPYYKRNGGYVFLFTLLAFGGIIAGVTLSRGTLAPLSFALIAALLLTWAGANYLIAAPTPDGQKLRRQIAGFRLYLETAEKDRLNAADITGKRPPPMTTQLYERFLSYAIALDVEEPWTEHFEVIMPRESAHHQLNNISGTMGHGGMSNMTKGMIAAMATGVAAAAPASSSGSVGGGSVGGGGGGGGGGGW
ncbi:DUF2207 domain-containing protein [Robiginitomaculum antarcticum]|uniref:DUF2207 domain-containing protein n=1 Tax=Robiginitomaculum antarcticum TaxID=437507 RepID=UPI0003616B0F|nr:DUF2207 domain-containing protein [Robiginitomaculum antarcticum]